MKIVHGICPGVLLALMLAGGGIPAQAGERQNFLVKLDGTFAEFVMYCRVMNGGAVRTVRYSELLPNSYRVTAEAVSCTVSMPSRNGLISAKLFENGKLIAKADEKATRPVVKLRSGGPWGQPKGAGLSMPARLVRPAEPQAPPADANPRDLLAR